MEKNTEATELKEAQKGLFPTDSANATSLYLMTKAEIDTKIATAKAFPRSPAQSFERALSLAIMNESVAASCGYALPRKDKDGNPVIISGPSIRLAEIVSASWGNIQFGARVISNNGKVITAQGFCHDLETNTSASKEVQVRITYKDGKTYNDDMQALAGNNACSKALRNAIFSIVPLALVLEILEKTKQVARGSEKTLDARRKDAVKFFTEQKISEKQICAVLGIKKVADIDLDKLGILIGMVTAAKTGEQTLKQIFDAEEEKKTAGGAKQIKDLIVEMSGVKTKAELNKIWDENKPYHKDKSFSDAFDINEARIETSKT